MSFINQLCLGRVSQMAKETVEVLGLKEMDLAIRKLTQATGKNFLAPALRKAANVIRDQARNNVPVDSTPDGVHVKEDIKVRRDSNPKAKGQNEIMYVKPFSKPRKKRVKGQRRKQKNDLSTYYWRFVELGTVNQRGQRFLTRAHSTHKMIAVTVFKDTLGKMIIRETKRLKK